MQDIRFSKSVIRRVALIAMAAVSTQLLTGVAFAQDDEELEEIVVKGTRSDLADAVNAKRASDTMSDFIVAADIGNLPDVNIADSLQRVPGVQVQRNDRGQTAEVTIRGLPSNFTQVLYNGRPVTTGFSNSSAVFDNRNFQAFIVPSSFVQKIKVGKSSKADMVAGGIAGTVDVVSRKASSYKDLTLAFDARGRQESNSGEISQNYSALLANTFRDDKLGFLVGVNYVNEKPDQHRTRGGFYDRLRDEQLGRDLNGDGDFVDTDLIVRRNVILENFPQRRERYSIVSNLECIFKPAAAFRHWDAELGV